MTDARALQERVARAIYDAMEGPVNNQDYARQVAQWNRAIEIADAALALVLEEAATTIAPPSMPPCRCIVWNNDGWFMECGCKAQADIQEAAAWCARHNAAAEIRALGQDQP